MNKKINLYTNIFIIFSIVIIALSIFYNFFYYDDAWILKSFSNYKKGILTTWGLAVPKGSEYLYDLLFIFNINYDDYRYYFLSRLVFLIASLLSLFLVYKITTECLNFKKESFIFFLIVFVYWFAFHSGGITSRPDSMISFCLIFSIFSYFYYEKNKVYLLISLFINLLFFFYHPLIYYVIFINLFLIFLLLVEKKIKLLYFFFILLIFIIFFITQHERIIIYFKDTSTIFIKHYFNKIDFEIKKENIIQLILSNIYTDLSLKGRVAGVYRDSLFTLIYFFVLYLISFLNIIFFFYKKKNKYKFLDENRFFLIFAFIFISINIFYLLLPNKWSHHLSVVVPILGIMLMYFFNFFKNFLKILNISNVAKYVMLISCLLFLINMNYYISKNLVLKKFINIYFDTKNIQYFNNLTKDENKIVSLSEKYRNKKIYGSPQIYYLFDRSNFIAESLIYLKSDVPDIIVTSTKGADCNYYSKRLKYHYEEKENFVFNSQIWRLCIK